MPGKLKFVKRGGALAATIAEDDLAAHEWGQDVPDPLPMVRAQELDLPIEVDVIYVNPAQDYQQSVQRSQRMTGSSKAVVSVPLPIVLSDAKAKQAADVGLFNLWSSRTSYSLALSRKWSKLEPTDVIDVPNGSLIHRMRIVKKDDSKPGLLKLEAVFEDSAIYTQSGAAVGAGAIPVQVLSVPSQTYFEFIDIPLLRDADDDAGFYVAACGYRAGWNGCQIFKSSDGGLSYIPIISITSAATMGVAITALGSFASGNIFDENNRVDVQMINGSLSSASELAVLNGANVAVIGNEVVQFKNATLVSAGIYRLSGFIRAKKGTMWASSLHNIGERYVLANVNTWHRISPSSAEIGLARQYKVVSFGRTLQQTAARTFTNKAEGLECLNPIEPGGGKNSAGDIVLSWKRQARKAAEWRDSVDAYQPETTESYEVDIISNNAVIRKLIGINTNTATYPAVSIATDFPSGIWSQIGGADGAGIAINGGWGTGRNEAQCLVTDGTNLYAGLGGTAGDAEVWKFNGANWSQIGGDAINSSWANTTYESVRSMAWDGTNLYAGLGSSVGDSEVWRFNDTSWLKIGGDAVNSSWAAGTTTVVIVGWLNGILYAGTQGAAGDADIWRFDGTSWSQIGGDGLNSSWVAGTKNGVLALISIGSDIYIGTGSSTAGDAEVWRWNGTIWSQIGGDGLNSSWNTNYETAFCLTTDGTNLYAGLGLTAGDAEVWRWNGTAWSKIGGDAVNSSWNTGYEYVLSMTWDGTNLYAGLGLSGGDAELWKFNGTSWSQIGGDGVNSSWNDATLTQVAGLTILNNFLYASLAGSTTGGAEVWRVSLSVNALVAPLTVDIYQLSSIVGRGRVGRGLIYF